MQKIVYINTQKEMVEDLETAAMIEFELGFELHGFYRLEGIEATVSALKPDLVVISYNTLPKKNQWDFKGIPIAFQAADNKELKAGIKYGFPTIGVAKTSQEILKRLGEPPHQVTTDDAENGSVGTEKKEKSAKSQVKEKAKASASQVVSQAHTRTKRKEAYAEKENAFDNETDEDENSDYGDGADFVEEDEDSLDEWEDDEYDIDLEEEDEEEDMTEDEEDAEEEDEDDEPEPPRAKKYPKQDRAVKKSQTSKDRQQDNKQKQETPKSQKDIIKEGFQRDTGKNKKKTKVITVYSAKGGVGKTTIASELATYLALVNVGRKKLKVCIVDYNIDFGDVRATLHITGGTTLTDWAEEVQELMAKGKKPEEIRYSRDEIEDWMQVEKKSGLFVLPAPLSNEDSMDIESEALSVILDNIVKYGGFDYVVCDTGNNTRDSTMIALEKATTILLIMTQNVNTANCDKTFVDTMHKIEFDLSNAKLVINNIMPQKTTGLSVQEIVEFFPYDCIGKLKFNTDVVKAGNLGEPLAFKPGHEFTKQLRSIVSYILQDGNFEEHTVAAPKKKSIFAFLKK